MSPPDLPPLIVLEPDPFERPRSAAAKYGGLYYLGIAGLIALVGLVAWFALSAWGLRSVWSNIAALHDPGRPEAERVAAARALIADPRVTAPQREVMALRPDLPEAARFLLADSLGGEAAALEPVGTAWKVAREADQPDWFRLLRVRSLAIAADATSRIPREPLAILADHPDPALRLWVDYLLAVARDEADARARLGRSADEPGPDRELAALLRDAAARPGPGRKALLEEASRWMKAHHPAFAGFRGE